jgi:CheY-like chemotaxis protein
MKKILVIEDDPVVGSVYQRFLQGEGFVTEVARDGVTGLERISTFAPDAVLLDMMLPKMGGGDVLKHIRAQAQFQDLPVIVLTNAAIPAFVEQATQAGANHVIDKAKASPVGVLALIQRLIRTEPHAPAAPTL